MVPLPLMPYGPLVGTTVFQEVLLVRKLSLNIISELLFHWVTGSRPLEAQRSGHCNPYPCQYIYCCAI